MTAEGAGDPACGDPGKAARDLFYVTISGLFRLQLSIMNNKEFVSQIPQPAVSRFIFSDTRAAWIWLVPRVYVGWIWLQYGWDKVNSPLWTGDKAGLVVKGMMNGAINKSTGELADVMKWYAFLLEKIVVPNAEAVAHIVAYGELLVGIGLIVGALSGIAAFFGLTMNICYLFAGTVSVNPPLAVAQLFLVLSWRVCGWVGLDRVLLPQLGTPWQPGRLFTKKAAT